MAVFSTNQNRQFYVASKVVTTTPAAEGEIQLASTSDGKVFFKHYGKGGLTRSDLIDKSCVTYAHVIWASALARNLKTATIALNSEVNEGKLVAGQDYIVRIYIRNYIASGDGNVTIKYGAVHAYSGMTTTAFYEALAKSLTQNFSREVQPLLTFEATSNGVKITEVEQPWHLGTMSQEPVNFEVVGTTILLEGDEVEWATVTYADSDTVIADGKKIADLEYFCMGERGDQHRNLGWPNAIPTEYMVDATKAYDVIDIHYAFSDTGVNVQKSEKDITIVGVSGDTVISTLVAQLSTYLGVTITERGTAETIDGSTLTGGGASANDEAL